MDEKLIESLSHFIQNPHMWIHPVNRETIISFIHGFESGSQNNKLTFEMRKLLSESYEIKYSSDGWSGQIDRLSEKQNSNWIEIFKKEKFTARVGFLTELWLIPMMRNLKDLLQYLFTSTLNSVDALVS